MQVLWGDPAQVPGSDWSPGNRWWCQSEGLLSVFFLSSRLVLSLIYNHYSLTVGRNHVRNSFYLRSFPSSCKRPCLPTKNWLPNFNWLFPCRAKILSLDKTSCVAKSELVLLFIALLHLTSLICNTDPLLFCMLYTSLHSPPALIRCVPMTRKLVARPPRWRKHSLTIGAPTTWSSGVPTTLASAKARSSSYGEASTSPLKKRGRVRWQSPLFSLRQMVSQLIKN